MTSGLTMIEYPVGKMKQILLRATNRSRGAGGPRCGLGRCITSKLLITVDASIAKDGETRII